MEKKIFNVSVKPNSKKELIEQANKINLKAWVKEPAKQERANTRLIELLAEFFSIPKSNIKITRGLKSKNKIVELRDSISK